MKARVATSALRRLDALTRPQERVKRGGYLVLPPILDLAEWEALALQHQRDLIQSHAEDRAANRNTDLA